MLLPEAGVRLWLYAPPTDMKVLYFEQGGYCLWSKRLEEGRFHFNAKASDKVGLSWTELKLIIEGIDLASVRRFKRYRR